ncbi:MAG TPA: non-homologous end-joining DNA ligase [Nitrospirales bacterium]
MTLPLKNLVAPMMATLVSEPFHRPGWVFEEKYDGIRAVVYRRGTTVRLVSRNYQDLTAGFPEIVAALKALPGKDFILDGEIVALDRQGVSRFQLLQQRGTADGIRARYAIFDCLELNGVNFMKRPLADRRRALLSLLLRRQGVLFPSRRLSADGLKAYRSAQERGWEGIIAKDDAAPYEPGRRTATWLKVKVRKESEFVIGGCTAPKGGRQHFGALLVGLYDGPSLRFTGKVGTGFTQKTLEALWKKLDALHVANCLFSPPVRMRTAMWVKPELVAQIAFAEWTADGKLRQPVFLGVREDKSPADCRWEDREQ